jgi:transposase
MMLERRGSMPTHRTFSAAFKAQVVLEVLSGSRSQVELAREHQLKPDLITRWKREFLENAASVFDRQNPSDASAARIAELEQALAQNGGARDRKKKRPAS